jgi:hypothetical protein
MRLTRGHDGAAAPAGHTTTVHAPITINLNGPWEAIDAAIPRRVVAKVHDALDRYTRSVH